MAKTKRQHDKVSAHISNAFKLPPLSIDGTLQRGEETVMLYEYIMMSEDSISQAATSDTTDVLFVRTNLYASKIPQVAPSQSIEGIGVPHEIPLVHEMRMRRAMISPRIPPEDTPPHLRFSEHKLLLMPSVMGPSMENVSPRARGCVMERHFD